MNAGPMIMTDSSTVEASASSMTVTSAVPDDVTVGGIQSATNQNVEHNEVFAALSDDLQATVLALQQQQLQQQNQQLQHHQQQQQQQVTPTQQDHSDVTQPDGTPAKSQDTKTEAHWSVDMLDTPSDEQINSQPQDNADPPRFELVSPQPGPSPSGVFQPENEEEEEEKEEHKTSDIGDRLFNLDDTHIVIQQSQPRVLTASQVRPPFSRTLYFHFFPLSPSSQIHPAQLYSCLLYFNFIVQTLMNVLFRSSDFALVIGWG